MQKFLLILLFFPIISVSGQNLNAYLEIQNLQHTESDSLNHSSVRDLYLFTQTLDSSRPERMGTPWHRQLLDKLFTENLVYVKRPGFLITADPLFHAGVGRELVKSTDTWVNTRGFQVYGKVALGATQKGKFEFYTSFYESQVRFPSYLDSLSSRVSGVPGQGRFHRADGTWDHGYSTGWARYTPNRYFSFELGNGKNFFGTGYRSLLLSDNSRNYPYFRIDTRLWRVHYTNLWAEFQDNRYQDGPNGAYQKKYGAFHHLSYSITNRLELCFFEAVIWQGRDSLHTRGFDVTYLNPVIFYRPVEWTLGSPDNALMGVNLSYRFGKQTYLYGQFLVDEFGVDHMKARDGWWANKYAGQIGGKTFIPFVGKPGKETEPSFPFLPSGLFLQSEFTFTRPYTYSHWTTKQNYGHLSQPLAHPLGGNFMEWVNFARVHYRRFQAEGRYSWAKFGSNTGGLNYGHDIFIPYTSHVSELGNFTGQGLSNTLTYKSVSISYLINPSSLLNAFVTVTDRLQRAGSTEQHAVWVEFGVRSSVRNMYYDF